MESMRQQSINLRKIHSKGKVCLGKYFTKLNMANGEFVIVEESDAGVIKLTPVRIEKKTFCKD